ncbi:kynureninase [Aureispira anguillae]|nr:kynureninase [Aureispira anguillae]
MDTLVFETSLAFAQKMDEQDALKIYRDQFHLPKHTDGNDSLYFCGNSLGLQPKKVESYLQQELNDWKKFGVEGHFHAKNAWMPYHEFFSKKLAKIVGAQEQEVVVMNTLTTNLHLMMVSFYRPTAKRHKIVIEKAAFPSDKYAMDSQIRFHGYDPQESLIQLSPRTGEETLRIEDIEATLRENADEIALVMLGGVNYYTGQFFDLEYITQIGHEIGALVGFDLAHAAGNVVLKLHDWNVDFAVWCHYKYLNSGPGAIAGAFVHDKHLHDPNIPRFEGWWGHDKNTRFLMGDTFHPMASAESWQLSNAPVFSMTPLLASLELFDEVGMDKLQEKSKLLTAYMEFLLQQIETDRIQIITPSSPKDRGCQLSIQVKNGNKALFDAITAKGVIADWREPDVIRVAPVPLYNNFMDVYQFVEILKSELLG